MEVLTNQIQCYICSAALLLGACVTPEEQHSADTAEYVRQHDAPASTMVYECGEEYTFIARVQNDTAWVFLPGQTVALLRAASESGAQYELEDTGLWIEGEQALLRQGDDEVRECLNNRRHAIWEHAKLNGADFRAVGNEPGWHMEIHHDRIILVADYGAATYEFETPEPIEDQAARQTVYEAANGSRNLTVLLEGGGCTDTMSGEEFDVAVTATLDDRVLRGCGRALH